MPGSRSPRSASTFLDAVTAQCLEHAAHLVARVVHRHQVGHRLDAELALDARHQAEGERPARLVQRTRDRDEIRRQRGQLAERAEQRLDALVRLRREELEREDGSSALVELAHAHGRFPVSGGGEYTPRRRARVIGYAARVRRRAPDEHASQPPVASRAPAGRHGEGVGLRVPRGAAAGDRRRRGAREEPLHLLRSGDARLDGGPQELHPARRPSAT